MDKIKKVISKHYKLLLSFFFIISLSSFIIYVTIKVNAEDNELLLASKAIIFVKDPSGNVYSSGQSAAVDPEGNYAFVFVKETNPSSPGTITNQKTTMIIFKKNSSGEFIKQATIDDIDCGHANSATYYSENNKDYVMIATSAESTDEPAVVKLELNLNTNKIVSTKKIKINKVINGIAWDYDRNRIIITETKDRTRMLSCSTNFSECTTIREKKSDENSNVTTIGAPRGGKKSNTGKYYNNQAITYYNNKIYAAHWVQNPSPCEEFATGMDLNKNTECTSEKIEANTNYVTVFDVETGDYSHLMYVSGDTVAAIAQKNNYYTGSAGMREIEDIVFIDGKMYLCFQKAGNYAIIKVTTDDSKVFEYNKLYVNYYLNGGSLASEHGEKISTSNGIITVNGKTNVVMGQTGEYLKGNSFYDYNNASLVNIEKKGYHIDPEKAWKDENGTIYSQTKKYRVYEIKDTSLGNKTIKLYANWVINNYSIQLDANGGTGTPPAKIKLNYGASATLPDNTFKRTGYTFSKWNTKANGSGTSYSNKATVKNLTTENNVTVKLYAQWNPISYSLKLVNNDGTSKSKTVSLKYDKDYTLSSYKPSRTGYTLLGWSKNSNATTPTYSTSSTVSNLTSTSGATVTLYAVWEKNTYTVSFNSTGGSAVSSISRKYGEKIGTLPTSTKTGYTLAGWYTERKDGTVISTNTTVTKNVTYYAHWTPIKYSIVFNSNGGTGTMSKLNMQYDTSAQLTANTFTRNGYIFSGWNTKADGKGQNYSNRQSVSNLTTVPNSTITLYAKWTVNSGYRIEYDLDGGNVDEDNPVTYDVTTPTFKLNNPTKTGYTFTGWTGSNGTTPMMEVTVPKGTTGNLSYKANYKANKYQLTFKWEDETEIIELDYNTTVVNVPQPNKKGYVLVGWFDESGNELANTVLADNKTFFAEFRPIKYKLLFNSNGGSGNMQNQVLSYDEEETIMENTFIKDKYVFKNWNTKADGTGTEYSDQEEILNLTDIDEEGIVLYAIWEEKTTIDDENNTGDENYSSGSDADFNDESNAESNKTIENPKTGATIKIIYVIAFGIISVIVYKMSSKKLLKKKI